MSELRLEDSTSDLTTRARTLPQKKASLSGKLVQLGIVRTEQQGSLVLIGVLVLLVIGTYLLWPEGSTNQPIEVLPEPDVRGNTPPVFAP